MQDYPCRPNRAAFLFASLALAFCDRAAHAAPERPVSAPTAPGVSPTEPPPPTAPITTRAEGPPREAEWYGWQTLLVDGAGLAVGLAAASPIRDAASEPPSTAGVVAAAMYGVGATVAPGVHLAHHRLGPAFASLGLRLLLPPVTSGVGFLGACFGNRDFDHRCTQDGLTGGFLVGTVGAAAIDAAVLSFDKGGPREAARTWYGWQTAMVDGVGIALGAAAAATPPKSENKNPGTATFRFGAIWWVTGFLAAPIVHFAHGRVGMGFADFGTRVGLAGVGALAGVVGYCAATDVKGCTSRGAEYGLIGGVALSAVIDAVAFSVRSAPSERASAEDNEEAWVPAIVPQRGGALVSLGRAF
jgi:hypothetical protein